MIHSYWNNMQRYILNQKRWHLWHYNLRKTYVFSVFWTDNHKSHKMKEHNWREPRLCFYIWLTRKWKRAFRALFRSNKMNLISVIWCWIKNGSCLMSTDLNYCLYYSKCCNVYLFVKLLFIFAIAKLQKVCRCAFSMRKTRFAIR